MKKILTVSLVAMMAVTAANADIASTKYVTDRTGNLQFTNSEIIGESGTLTAAVDAVAAKVADLSADMGDGGAVSDQIGSAIGGLDSTQDGTGTVVKNVSQTDGKVSVTFGTIANADVAEGAGIDQSKIANLTTDLEAKQTKANITTKSTVVQDKDSEVKYPSVAAAYQIAADATGSLTTGLGSLQGAVGANNTDTFKTNMANTTYLEQSGTAVAAVKALDAVIDDIETDLANQKNANVEGSLAAQIKDMKDATKEGSVANTVAGIETDLGTVTPENMGTDADNVADAIKEVVTEKADKADTLAGYGINNAYTKTETDSAITTKVETLDVTDTAVAGEYVSAVSETDGKISVTRAALTPVAKMDVPADCATKLCALVYDKENSIAGNPVLKWEVIAE